MFTLPLTREGQLQLEVGDSWTKGLREGRGGAGNNNRRIRERESQLHEVFILDRATVPGGPILCHSRNLARTGSQDPSCLPILGHMGNL